MPARTLKRTGLVGGLSTLFYSAGAADFVLIQAQLPAYLRFFTDDQIVFLTGLAAWQVGLWAIGVLGGLTAGLALWAHAGWAAPGFALSAFCLLVFAGSLILVSEPGFLHVAGPIGALLLGVSVLLAFVFWALAFGMRRRGT